MVSKSIGEVLTWATIKWKGKKYVMVDHIIKAGVFKQALGKEVVSPLLEYFMGMGIIFGGRHSPYLVL